MNDTQELARRLRVWGNGIHRELLFISAADPAALCRVLDEGFAGLSALLMDTTTEEGRATMSTQPDTAVRARQFERLVALLDECELQLERLARWGAPGPSVAESRGIALEVLTQARTLLRELETEE